jgi:chromosome segregation ATPase
MSLSTNLKILMAAIAVIAIAGALYIAQLRSELIEAQQRASVFQREVTNLKVTITRLEGERTTATNERDAMQSQLSESSAQLAKLSNGQEKASESLTNELSALRARVDFQTKVSGWWRGLFDYTKTFNRGERSSMDTAAFK